MSTRTLFATTAIAMGSSAALLFSGVSTADPSAPLPLPIDGLAAPGLPAVQSLSPAIQQAAADPSNAASMLMAAAAAFAGNQSAPSDSQGLASAVSQFVSDPAAAAVISKQAAVTGSDPLASNAHIPAPGVIPGAEAHLLPGVDPSHAVGPDPATAEPLAATAPATPSTPAVAAAPDAVPVAASSPAPGPAAGATTGPNTAPPGYAPDTPPTQDFMYPSIGNGCLADGGNALATAISVAGPANIPVPGPGPAQTAYVFTAVGTSGPADVQKLPLNVTWVNLTTGKSGSATLKPRSDINPQGPTTLTAVVDTGSGSIMSTIFGQVTTTDKQCQFMPTIGSTVVP
jgi:hypothetical protein